jgi:hypothetical protein
VAWPGLDDLEAAVSTPALAVLRALLGPFILAAMPTDYTPAWAHLRIGASPLDVQLVSADPAGTERCVHGVCGVSVLDAVTAVLQAWHATLPPAEVQRLGARLEREAGRLWLLSDLGLRNVTIVIDTDVADEAEIVGVLSDEVRH